MKTFIRRMSPLKVVVTVFGVTLLVLLYLEVLQYLSAASSTNALAIGDQAPSIELPSRQGTKIRLDEFKQRAVIVFFFSGTCQACLESAHYWAAVKRQYADRNLGFIGVTESKREDVDYFLRQTELDFPVLLDDGKVLGSYGVSLFPTTYLVGPDGRIAFISTAIPADEALRLLDARLQFILGS